MRKPIEEWAWDVNLIPPLKRKLEGVVMEYVKYTKKIYVLGGWSVELDSSTGKVTQPFFENLQFKKRVAIYTVSFLFKLSGLKKLME